MVELLGNPQRVMAVFAHPDDAELLCFGLLKRLARAGASIKIVIVSDGSKGVAVGKHAPHDLPLIRMDETQAALAGVTGDVLTLSQPDGVLRMDADLMTNIETMILHHRPELVVSHYVDPMGIDHNDHRVIGAAVRNICYRKPFVKTMLSCEPIQPHTDFNPTLFVEITAQFEEKCAALEMHASQAGRIYLSPEYTRSRASRWMRLDSEHSVPTPGLFEAFRVEKMVIS